MCGGNSQGICLVPTGSGRERRRDSQAARRIAGCPAEPGDKLVAAPSLGPDLPRLRTSFIGRELDSKHGLLEWFLSQKGKSCRGFSKAIFSGLTTVALAELVGDIIVSHRELCGLYHVGADPISKHDLLGLINEVYDLGVRIEKDEEFACDRSLDSSRFRKATGWQPASWRAMLVQMKKDGAAYEA